MGKIILLKKINIDENSYPYFSDAKITKIKVNSKKDSWLFFIKKDTLLPVEILEELETKKSQLDENASSIDFIFEIEKQTSGSAAIAARTSGLALSKLVLSG